jgi:hypothetical protein
VITHGVKLPNLIINGITEHTDRLVGIPGFKREYLLDPFPIQIPDRAIQINHPIIPIRELVFQGIEVEYGNQ